MKTNSRLPLLRWIILAAMLLVFAGWGSTGHRIINGSVIFHLPPEMSAFVQQGLFLANHASDADNRKGGDGQKPYLLQEGPRHFIDVDNYPEFASKTVPKDLSALIAQYDSATVFDIGILPWAIVWTLDSLTAQLHRADWQRAWQSAADLGHYVGDAHQPLHNTKDYNGRASLSGSNGIHSRYETAMINANQNSLAIEADTVHFIPNPIEYAFNIVYQSNSYVDSIYIAEANAHQASGWNGNGQAPQGYLATLWEETKGFTQLQFQRATLTYANFLYTAWVNAGSPVITSVGNISSSTGRPKSPLLGYNYPNPFNPSTTINYQLPTTSFVSLKVYDLLGHQVAQLVNTVKSAGAHTASWNANGMPSGIYFYALQTANDFEMKKMLVLK
jgi:hypothetical protein